MKITRAILTAIIVWGLGVAVFVSSYYLPFLKDPEQQANVALALALIPLGWLGAKSYYSANRSTPGYQLAIVMVGMAIILDALITVPLLILPVGGTYREFFSAPSFWFIAMEYFLVVMLHWFLKVKPSSEKSFS